MTIYPMVNNENGDKVRHKIELDGKQIEFLIRCIDISQSTQSIKPDMSEIELIRRLTLLSESIDEDRFGTNVMYDYDSTGSERFEER